MKCLGLVLGLLSALTTPAADVLDLLGSDGKSRDPNGIARAMWASAGVPGGIWQYRSRTIVNATGLTDTSGGTDYTATIQAQINALSEGQCLLLPAGTFRLNGGLSIGIKGNFAYNNNVTLRGAGMGQTILMLYGNAGVSVSGGGNGSFHDPGYTLAADVAAGANTLTLSGSGEPVPGLHFMMEGYHDPSNPLVSVAGFDNVRTTYLKCLAVSGNVVTFSPALPFPLKAGAKMKREVGTNAPYYICHTTGVGLEDLTVDGANATAQILVGLFHAENSWLYNVEAKNVNNRGIGSVYCINSSIVHCKIHDHKDQGSYTSRELLQVNTSTQMLYEDNIIYNGYCGIEMNGVMGSAFSHNIIDRICIGNTIGSAFNINHGPHGCFNVFEGNITPRIQSDGYFGSSSHETMHRNWFHGTNGVHTTDFRTGVAVTANRLPLTLNRFTHWYNIAGNLIGRTGVGVTWAYINVGPPYASTSSTSRVPTLGGDQTMTIGLGLGWVNGMAVAFISRSDPNKWFTGRCENYNSSTGVMAITIFSAKGTGGSAANDWDVFGGSGYGNDLLYALGGPNIGNGGWFGDPTISAAQTRGIWWRSWDGARMNRRGSFNSGTAYNISGSGPTGQRDVVDFVADAPYGFGGNSILNWVAANAAKSGTATWATPGPSQTDWVPISPNGFQELDYDVYATAIFKDNWNAATNGIHSSEALGSDTYPVSRIRSGSTRPAFFGSSLTYPAFDSHSPNQSFEAIPAGYRYIHGTEVPGYSPNDSLGPPPAAPSAPGNLVAAAGGSGQINLTWIDNATNESGFRILGGTNAGAMVEIGYVGANVTSYTASGLTAGTQYFFKVEAYNAGGSAASNTTSATTSNKRMPIITKLPTKVQ